MNGIGERALVAQLLEESSAESAGDRAEEMRAPSRVVRARGTGKGERDRRLRLVSRLAGGLWRRAPARLWNLGDRARSDLCERGRRHSCRLARLEIGYDSDRHRRLEHVSRMPPLDIVYG